MQDENEWQELMARLAPVCRDLTERLAARSEGDVTASIVYALFQKGFDTYRGIAVLYGESLTIQGQVLVRVLLEVRMDLDIFLRLSASDPQQAARRVVDSMMLEKVKQQRQSDFRGLELVDGSPQARIIACSGREAGRAIREDYRKSHAAARILGPFC